MLDVRNGMEIDDLMRKFPNFLETEKNLIDTSNPRCIRHSKSKEKWGYKWYPYGANPGTYSTFPKFEFSTIDNYNDIRQGNDKGSVIADVPRTSLLPFQALFNKLKQLERLNHLPRIRAYYFQITRRNIVSKRLFHL